MPSSPSAADRAFLTRRPFAHRGLHGSGRVENSRAAFQAAIDAGLGIELDVQLAACGTAMVFHDATLDRLTGDTGALADRDAAALGLILLTGTDEPVSTLREILQRISGAVPVLIEVKAKMGQADTLARAVADCLADYAGEAAVMSFNPEVCRWLAAHAPTIVRGMVVSEQDKSAAHGPVAARLMEVMAKPQFLALDIRDLPSALSRKTRSRGLPVLTWTVRTEADRATARTYADQIIFEEAASGG